LAEYSYGFSHLEQHHKIGKKKKHCSGDKFCGTSFDENLGKDVFIQRSFIFAADLPLLFSKCGDFR
jgi:hypothetical protein